MLGASTPQSITCAMVPLVTTLAVIFLCPRFVSAPLAMELKKRLQSRAWRLRTSHVRLAALQY